MGKTKREIAYSDIDKEKSSDNYDPYEYIYETWEDLNTATKEHHVEDDWDWEMAE